MQAWQDGWKPAVGDRAQVASGPGSGTVVEVEGQRIRLQYDLFAVDVDPRTGDIAEGNESGWHDREDVEPIEDTARRVVEGR